eukprot:7411562-Alexandrium_andersonii.AAC.1
MWIRARITRGNPDSGQGKVEPLAEVLTSLACASQGRTSPFVNLGSRAPIAKDCADCGLRGLRIGARY